MNDPWAGRSEGMRCKTCIFFVQKGDKEFGEKGSFGRCRRNSPTMKGYPVVFGMDWCGEHKLDENKI
ncbi:MAG: hypothetical protein FWG09_02215 [Synergistaceae bacterium]|nr:hypothetical protein [Synergistaceae bacterium]